MTNHDDWIDEHWLGCGNGASCVECGECRPNYGICEHYCGNCINVGTSNRNAVWYQSEEYPFTFGTFSISEGLLVDGSGYYYDDGIPIPLVSF